MQIQRGNKLLISLDPVVGSEQGKTRPCIVVQNDVGNEYAPTIIVIPITTNSSKLYPTDALLNDGSKAMCAQIRSVDKSRVLKKIGVLSEEETSMVDKALKVSLGLS